MLQSAAKGPNVESWIQGIARNVRDLSRDEGVVSAVSASESISRALKWVDRERAERALIGEDDGKVAVIRMPNVEPHALVPLRRRPGRAQQHLSAHTEVSDKGLRRRCAGITGRQRNPQELPPSRRTLQGAAEETCLEV